MSVWIGAVRFPGVLLEAPDGRFAFIRFNLLVHCQFAIRVFAAAFLTISHLQLIMHVIQTGRQPSMPLPDK